jgi:hypothetical protein
MHAPAVTVREAIGAWGTVEEVDDARCRLRMTSESLDWPLLALGSLRAEFEIVGPPDLAETLRDWGGRFTRAAGRPAQ